MNAAEGVVTVSTNSTAISRIALQIDDHILTVIQSTNDDTLAPRLNDVNFTRVSMIARRYED